MNSSVLGVGIDSVDIIRFEHWHTYSTQSLSRIFSAQEIEYCLSCPAKSSERFAARFALREAFLKAVHQAMPEVKISLLAACKAVSILKMSNGSSQIKINWKLLSLDLDHLKCSVSWTHTQSVATAIVLIQ